MAVKSPTDMQDDRSAGPAGLRVLRAELDRIDDATHDLLIERSRIVSRVGVEGRKAFTPYRPGREAAILRRLLARHRGPLDPQGIVRIWRELIAAGTALQGGHSVAVFDPDHARGYTQLAREQFGALVPLRVHSSPIQAFGEVEAGHAGIGVLPLPSKSETSDERWWTMLMERRWREGPEPSSRLHIVARLPFWSPRPEGAPLVQALAVSRAEPDPSGEDRSLLGLTVAAETGRARIADDLSAAGLPPRNLLLYRGETAALAEVDGFVTASDPRLDALGAGRARVLGAYAVPIGAEIA